MRRLLQSWMQSKPSTIRFDVAPKLAWDAHTNTWLETRGRSADVYVFCLLDEKDKSKVDPLDLNQWRFNVVNTEVLNQRLGGQKTVGLAALNILHRDWIGSDELAVSIDRAGTRL